MFILTKIADLVQISPEDFSKTSGQAIEDNINAKFANKVVQGIGLCICLYDILGTSEGLIGHGSGMVNVNVEFRMVVFRPFKGEVIYAKIRSSTPAGIHLRTDFFDDIFVPSEHLPEGTMYKHEAQLWIWSSDGNEFFYDNYEMVRVQILDEKWHDQGPKAGQQNTEEPLPSPYKLVGSMVSEGLGCCIWWDE